MAPNKQTKVVVVSIEDLAKAVVQYLKTQPNKTASKKAISDHLKKQFGVMWENLTHTQRISVGQKAHTKSLPKTVQLKEVKTIQSLVQTQSPTESQPLQVDDAVLVPVPSQLVMMAQFLLDEATADELTVEHMENRYGFITVETPDKRVLIQLKN